MRARHAGILLCCLFLGLFLSLFLPVQAVPLRVVVNHAPPYRIIDPPHYTGYYIELLKTGGRRGWTRDRVCQRPPQARLSDAGAWRGGFAAGAQPDA